MFSRTTGNYLNFYKLINQNKVVLVSKPAAAAIVITVEFWTFVESGLGSGPLPVTGNQVGTGGAAYHHTRGLHKN